MPLLVSTSKGAAAGNDVTTDAIDTTVALFLVLLLANFANPSTGTISDSKGNTWTALTNRAGGGYNGRLYYCIAPTVGSGHTFTYTITPNEFPTLCVFAHSDNVTSLDNQSGTGSGTQPGNITPAGNNRLFICGVTTDSTDSPTINSSFTLSEIEAPVGSQHVGGALAYKLQTTGGSENPTWSGLTTNRPVAMAAFVTSAPPPSITTTTLPNGTVGVAYSETLGVTGGTGSITWAVTVGALPDGLSLNSSTGEISGTPTQTGTFNFTVEAEDAASATDTQALSITIEPAPTGVLGTDGNYYHLFQL